MTNDYILELDKVSFLYENAKEKTKYALLDIDLKIKKGEFVAIMGENGAGKSTLSLTTNGIIPNAMEGEFYGRCRVYGYDTIDTPISTLAAHVGVCIQNPEAQLFSPNVKTELAFGPQNLSVPPEEILERIRWALRVVRLDGYEERSPDDLSGGQKQRVAIAANMTMKPDLLVLDEPTSQLDPIGTSEVFQTISKLNKEEGITILIAEHKSDQVLQAADRVILLKNGQILAEGPPEKIFSQEDLLRDAKIKPPQIAEIGYKLRSQNHLDTIPLTLEQCVKGLKPLLGSRKVKQTARSPYCCPTSRPVLEMQHVTFSYGEGILALKDLNLTIRRGEWLGIVGQNGAGKTTLVKHFLGLLKPTQGDVIVNGLNTRLTTPAKLSRRVGLVLQNPDSQLFAQSVLEEVMFMPKHLGIPAKETRALAEQSLKDLGIEHYINEHPVGLSWGDRQKVTVAAVLAVKPEIIIFDEPTTGQDFKGRYETMNLAQKLHAQGHTLITISHDMELIAKYVDRLIILGEGEILLDAPVNEAFMRTDLLQKTFLNPPPVLLLGQALKEYGFSQDLLDIDEFIQEFESVHLRRADAR